jgi:hypothetical protein
MKNIEHTITNESGAPGIFARTVLDMAAQVEAAEMGIKFEVLKAAEAGDMNRIIRIMTDWVNQPAVDVLKKSKDTP